MKDLSEFTTTKTDKFLARTYSNEKCYPMTVELNPDSAMWRGITVSKDRVSPMFPFSTLIKILGYPVENK